MRDTAGMPIERIAELTRWLLPAVVAGIVAVGCGGDGNRPVLSEAGEAGRTLANDSGCGACHGRNGQGAVGPEFTGLYGREVELADGTTVVADDEYLIEAILDPNAKINAGYNVGQMPPNDLTEAQAASIVDYIRDLADQP